ncbi:DUF892 family protein [Mucilaginibacter agri]|uniref:DUF892 family protein n=1 Tax=Mucilaginibacter agri TaxID=2695265 RepID=A0A965ZM22_9SPHI|nr:DUF892 family protein [Mucilaginibacter agri]NCD72537.1 DUF892 family protein [Mucilaginibacter agri]
MLVQQDRTTVFLHTLSTVYHMKHKLIHYLPMMIKIASDRTLKLNIMHGGININATILRMDMIFKIFKDDSEPYYSSVEGEVTLEAYLHSIPLHRKCARNDFVMITHLLILAGIEVNSFRQLKKIAESLNLREVKHLVNQCLIEAIDNKRLMTNLTDDYLLLDKSSASNLQKVNYA